MRTRLVVLVAALGTCLGAALAAVPLTQANADGERGGFTYKVLDMCGGPTEQQCVMAATRDGVPVTSDYPSSTGTHEWFYVDNGWRDGIFSFNLNTITVPPSGPTTASKDVALTTTWMIKVNTGPYVPREFNAKVRDLTFTKGGNATDGYWFQATFKPVPIAWRWDDGPYGCDMTYCGTDATVAEFVSADGKGVADGYATDLADLDLGSRFVYARTGFSLTSNAQYQGEPYYDADTNSLVVEMANPHLRAVGVPATGFFEAFIPNAYLINQLGVPDPTTLKTGSFVITKTVGTVTQTANYSATAEPGGISLKINTTFSKPRFRITPKPKAPGVPRLTGVKKLTGAARVSFLPPLANGGKKVDKYQAKCHKAGGTWYYKVGTGSPITVTGLPAGTVYCQARAHNAIGWGNWGKVGTSRT